MKKKIKDLTFDERMRICDKYKTCEGCPLCLGIDTYSVYVCGSEIMNKEVEIDDSDND